MTFEEHAAEEFLRIYSETSPLIVRFPGCRHLELWQREDAEGAFATYSVWSGAEALERYRTSELFRNTWARVKPLFAAPAQAESYTAAARTPD